MKVLVTDNAHLYKTPDGKYYTPTIYSYDFLKRYLNVFEEVRFAAKTKHVDNIDTTSYLLVSGKNLEIYELPWYQGVKGMSIKIFNLLSRYRKISKGCDCYIYRIAQIESFFAYVFSNKNKPFAVEMVNDPQAFKDMNSVFRFIYCMFTKYMINKADGVSYVTREYLQKKYPRKNIRNVNYFENYYSSISISSIIIDNHKKDNKFSIVHLSNHINNYMKGHMVLLKTLKYILNEGYDVTVTFIGDGKLLPDLNKHAIEMSIKDHVIFTGRLYLKKDVLTELSKHNLFVFPSYYEGLPRVIIEAQAAGLPCLSSNVGGIPELINSKYLYKPDDYVAFARSIIRLINNPFELEQMRLESIENAKMYTEEKLQKRRNAFYEKLKLRVEKNYI